LFSTSGSDRKNGQLKPIVLFIQRYEIIFE
jgi:hypothetical protein